MIWVFVVFAMIGFAAGCVVGNKWRMSRRCPDCGFKPNERGMEEVIYPPSDDPAPDDSVDVKPPQQFPVAGKLRRVPWHVRRKELEAAAQTKRQRMEAWDLWNL